MSYDLSFGIHKAEAYLGGACKIWIHMLLFHQICTLIVRVRNDNLIHFSCFYACPLSSVWLKCYPSKHNRAAVKEMETLNAEVVEMEQRVKEVEQRNHSLRSKKKELNEELAGLRAKVEVGQRECNQLLKELEVNREEEAKLTGDGYEL